MGQIKSAFEIAMERVQRLDRPTKEKQLEWKWVPEGRRLAAEHLRDRGDLATALGKGEPEQRPYLLRGALEVLAANIQLPKTQVLRETTDRALEALRKILRKSRPVEEIITRVQYVCDQYQGYGNQQRQMAYQQLKQEFQAQLQQALRGQTGAAVDVAEKVEHLPEFQQEWLRLKFRLEQQYEEHLEQQREAIQTLT